MQKLNKYIDLLETKIEFADYTSPLVSKSSVAWHIEHAVRALKQITKAIIESNPSEFEYKFSAIRIIVMTTGTIPRGKGKAPKSVTPQQIISKEELRQNIADLKHTMIMLDKTPKDHFFKHPVFGNLKYKDAIRFMVIHTNHHLKIIDDIIKNN